MLILLSRLTICQVTDTKPTNCFDNNQIEQFYKGLKQGEYLKKRLRAAEKSIALADTLIDRQRNKIAIQDELITIQEDQKNTLSFRLEKSREKHIKELQIKDNEITYLEKQAKKQFWRGTKAGAVAGVAVTLIAVILVN